MTPERISELAQKAYTHIIGLYFESCVSAKDLEPHFSAAIAEATASIAAECERLRKMAGEAIGGTVTEFDLLLASERAAREQNSNLERDLKAAREEIAGLRESEKALYETVTAIATALGVEVWGYEELAPAVRVVLDERKAAREECAVRIAAAEAEATFADEFRVRAEAAEAEVKRLTRLHDDACKDAARMSRLIDDSDMGVTAARITELEGLLRRIHQQNYVSGYSIESEVRAALPENVKEQT